MTDDEINDRIDEWHSDALTTQQLHEYLGWTWDEYKHWVETNEQPSRD